MSYITSTYGWIHIEPPLCAEELYHLPEMEDLLVDLLSIRPVDKYNTNPFVEDLQTLVDVLGGKHQFLGYIECQGEEIGDYWRLAVIDGKAVQVRPEMVWPDNVTWTYPPGA